jgi:hypothetical protein
MRSTSMLLPLLVLAVFASVLAALFWWGYRTCRNLWRRGTSAWGNLVYNYGVRGYGATMAVFLIALSGYVGATQLATSEDDRFACTVVGLVFGALFGTPVALGLGYFWGVWFARVKGLEPDTDADLRRR